MALAVGRIGPLGRMPVPQPVTGARFGGGVVRVGAVVGVGVLQRLVPAPVHVALGQVRPHPGRHQRPAARPFGTRPRLPSRMPASRLRPATHPRIATLAAVVVGLLVAVQSRINAELAARLVDGGGDPTARGCRRPSSASGPACSC